MARGGSSVTFACGAAQQGRTGRSHATRAREPPASTQRTGGGRGQIRQCLWVHTLSHSVPSRYGRAKAGLVVRDGGPRSALCSASGPRPARRPRPRPRAQRQSAEPDVACVVRSGRCRLSGPRAFCDFAFYFIFRYFCVLGGSVESPVWAVSRNSEKCQRERTAEQRNARRCEHAIAASSNQHAPRPESPDGDYRFFGLTFPPRSSRGAPPRRTAQGTLGLTAASATLHLHSSTAEKETQNPNRE